MLKDTKIDTSFKESKHVKNQWIDEKTSIDGDPFNGAGGVETMKSVRLERVI